MLNREAWGVASELSKQDQEKLKNVDDLPFGKAASIIRKVDPIFGIENPKIFKVRIYRDTVKKIREYAEVKVAASDEEAAEKQIEDRIGNTPFLDNLKFGEEEEIDSDFDDYGIEEVDEIAEENN